MPAPDFMGDDNWNRPVIGKVTPARGVPIVRTGRLLPDDIERIAQRVAELIKADK